MSAARGRDLVEQEDARLRDELRRERDSNRDFEHRCPQVPETACYRRGPLRPSQFYTTRDYLVACIKREHARFNPAGCGRRGTR